MLRNIADFGCQFQVAVSWAAKGWVVKKLRLIAALTATLLVATVVTGGALYAQSVENQYIYALAPMMSFQQKNLGSALQQAAFHQPDLLPLYGSSELRVDRSYLQEYRASSLFKQSPTGFTIFPIGTNNTNSLIILQKLAAIGANLRGKKVVVSISPVFFYRDSMISPESYAANFSRLHAGELAFSTDLSFDLKQATARRMLDYPNTLKKDPILRFALEKLADGSLLSRALYAAILPLGKLQNLILRLQDHWETLTFIWHEHNLKPYVKREPASIDWSELFQQAEQEYQKHASNNPFGFDHTLWKIHIRDKTVKNSWTDEKFLQNLQQSKEWVDLEMLLRGLKELHARPLILSMPIPGKYMEYLGVSSRARMVYYQKLREVTQAYKVPERDFEDHDQDQYFLMDDHNHLSSKGWVYYDQAIDAFYHDTIH